MKAMVCTQYGPPDVLHLEQVEKPVPKDNEILIKVRATAVNSGDWRLRKADPFAVRLFFGLSKPKHKILGGVLAGVVEEIGKGVNQFKVGDRVFGSTGMVFGAYAEFRCLPGDGLLAKIPDQMSFEEAASIPFGGLTALFFLRKAELQRGQKVLVYGASGAVGTAAVQIAKAFGADVTGVCSTANLELVKSLGAVRAIDYTKQDFSQDSVVYDCVIDTVGKMPLDAVRKVLKEKGCLILSGAGMKQMLSGTWISLTAGRKVLMGVVKEETEEVLFLKQLVESGQLKAAIDRKYPLEQLADAHTYVEQGHKKGNVVVLVS